MNSIHCNKKSKKNLDENNSNDHDHTKNASSFFVLLLQQTFQAAKIKKI
jgi:hypothetical protein